MAIIAQGLIHLSLPTLVSNRSRFRSITSIGPSWLRWTSLYLNRRLIHPFISSINLNFPTNLRRHGLTHPIFPQEVSHPTCLSIPFSFLQHFPSAYWSCPPARYCPPSRFSATILRLLNPITSFAVPFSVPSTVTFHCRLVIIIPTIVPRYPCQPRTCLRLSPPGSWYPLIFCHHLLNPSASWIFIQLITLLRYLILTFSPYHTFPPKNHPTSICHSLPTYSCLNATVLPSLSLCDLATVIQTIFHLLCSVPPHVPVPNQYPYHHRPLLYHCPSFIIQIIWRKDRSFADSGRC